MTGAVDPTTVLVRHPKVAAAELDGDLAGEVALHGPVPGWVQLVNPTAALVWRCLEEPVRVEDLVAVLAEVFGVDPIQVAADLWPLLDDWRISGLVGAPEEMAAAAPPPAWPRWLADPPGV